MWSTMFLEWVSMNSLRTKLLVLYQKPAFFCQFLLLFSCIILIEKSDQTILLFMKKHNIVHAMGRLAEYRANDLLSHCINKDLGLVHWDVPPNSLMNYSQTDYHTVSLYTQGGERTRRVDQDQSHAGGPGKICFMPAGSESSWTVGSKQRLVHIYISTDYFNYFLNSALDIDTRSIELVEKTFLDDPALQTLIYQQALVPAEESQHNQLLMAQTCQEIAGNLVDRYINKNINRNHFYGGLSSRHLRMIKEYIDTYFALSITLNQLAGMCNLSDYHFSRMFKAVCGLSPYQYLQYVRINKSQEMLVKCDRHSLADIAIDCGYANQSHFSKAFKSYTGMSPLRFRNVVLE